MPVTLGIVDWGVGGLGFYKELKKRVDAPVLYFSDNGFTPYGRTPTHALGRRLDSVFRLLFERGATHICIACNAASSAYPDGDNVNGIIQHGVNALRRGRWRKIGLIGGRRTVLSRAYSRHLQGMDLRQRVAQPLSAHVEAGRLSGEHLARDIQKIVAPIRASDAILLACTHYPAISSEIGRHLDARCELLDPATEMADWVVANWKPASRPASDRWFTTGDASAFRRSGRLAFQVDIGEVATVPASGLS